VSGQLTVWGAGQILTSYFNATNTPPTSFYLALIRIVAPTPYMSGAELDEPTNADYARLQIENDLAHWSNTSQPQTIVNMVPAQFITATSDWGQINYWALTNAAVDGYNLLVGTLETPVLIHAGDTASFEAGDITASLGPFFMADET
jgi:hypothetical protein